MQLEQIDLVKYKHLFKLKSNFTLGGETCWEDQDKA